MSECQAWPQIWHISIDNKHYKGSLNGFPYDGIERIASRFDLYVFDSPKGDRRYEIYFWDINQNREFSEIREHVINSFKFEKN